MSRFHFDMPSAFLLLLAIPGLALIAIRRQLRRGKPPFPAFMRVALLTLLAGTLCRPWLTENQVGSGEAYNYSLGLADAVAQIRAGEMPPMVGQTEYAWNGRIHPLRTAPYLFFLGAALDALTFRQLPVWQLQNLSLAFSLTLLVFGTYFALRRGLRTPPAFALVLTIIYAASPPVLSAAYGLELLMTVHVAVFAPVVLAAALRSARGDCARADWILGAGVAAAWWAHPPVALWLTLLVAPLRLSIWLVRPRWRTTARLLLVGSAFVAATAYVFASVFSLTDRGTHLPDDAAPRDSFVQPILHSISDAFPSSLKPVSATGGKLGDMQFGLLGWFVAVAALSWAGSMARKETQSDGASTRTAVGAVFLTVGLALGMVSLCLPIPFWTEWWWNHLPLTIHRLTNIWPMQRIYVVALAAVVMATGFACGQWRPPSLPRRGRWMAGIRLALIVIGVGTQAQPFLNRGLRNEWDAATTRERYASSNLDLTITSYAFLQAPPEFVHGHTDPRFEFRLLDANLAPLPSLREFALAHGREVATGTLTPTEAGVESGRGQNESSFVLDPGRHYLLAFDFQGQPIDGTLQITGSTLRRVYLLPAAGGPEGFGIGERYGNSLTLRTSESTPEIVRLNLFATAAINPQVAFAHWRLVEVEPNHFPIRTTGLMPLTFTTDLPAGPAYVVTPRRYIPGYVATIDGRRQKPFRSPYGAVMVPVPQGQSSVILSYEGTPALRAAFRISAAVWGLGGVFTLIALSGAGATLAGIRREMTANLPVPTGTRAHLLGASTVFALAAAAVWWGTTRPPNAAPAHGPWFAELILPVFEGARREALLSTGREGAGAVIFAEYESPTSLRLGVDVAGLGAITESIEVDPFRPHTLSVNSSALSPPAPTASPSTAGPPITIGWNGHTVLEAPWGAFSAKPDEIVAGANSIGSRAARHDFSGAFLSSRRVAAPSEIVLTSDQQLELEIATDTPPGDYVVLRAQVGSATGSLRLTTRRGEKPRLVFFSSDYRPQEIMIRQPRDDGLPQRLKLDFRRAGSDPGRLILLATAGRDRLLNPGDVTMRPEPALIQFAPGQPSGSTDGKTFAGSILRGVAVPDHAPGRRGAGPLRLLVRLPTDRIGRQEPLLVSGRPGAGDLVFVIYDGANRVRFGLDHWMFPARISAPCELALDQPHEIEIETGALYPAVGDPGWRRAPAPEQVKRAGRVIVRVNGKVVLSESVMTYPATPAELWVGRNAIGGSTADPEFTGEILESRWLGWTK